MKLSEKKTSGGRWREHLKDWDGEGIKQKKNIRGKKG